MSVVTGLHFEVSTCSNLSEGAVCLSTSLTRSYEGDDEVLLDDEAETEALWTWKVSLNASLLPSLHLASWAFLALCFSFAFSTKGISCWYSARVFNSSMMNGR